MECKMRNLVIAIVCFIIAMLCVVNMSFAAKAFFIIPMQGGSPNFGEMVEYKGFVLIGQIKGYGCYQISGTQAELDIIATKKDVVLLGSKSKTALEQKVPLATVSKVDTFLKAQSIPVSVSVNRSNNDVILDIAKKFEPLVKSLNDHYIQGLPEDEKQGVINEKVK